MPVLTRGGDSFYYCPREGCDPNRLYTSHLGDVIIRVVAEPPDGVERFLGRLCPTCQNHMPFEIRSTVYYMNTWWEPNIPPGA